MYFLLLLICAIYGSVSGADDADCDSNKCYQTVNNSYKNLLNSINLLSFTISQAKIPRIYDMQRLQKDFNELKKIENEFKRIQASVQESIEKLNQTENTVVADQEIVDRLLEKLSNISKYKAAAAGILNDAAEYLRDFENSLELGENASKTCQQAHDKYSEFKDIINEVSRDYDNVTTSYNNLNKEAKELNKDILNTLQETVNRKYAFDKLELPMNLVQDYLFKTEARFNETVARLKENVDLLKELLWASQRMFNDQLRKKAVDVEKYIAQIEDDVNHMNEDLSEYEAAFNGTDRFEPTVNSESRRLLDEIKRKLIQVENDFKAIDFSDEEKRLLLASSTDDQTELEELGRKRLLIKEYSLLLDAIPTDESKLQEIREQLITLRTTISLMEQWKYLNEEVKRLRMNRDAVLNINCTQSQNNSGLTT